jgi:hypothetical protein
VGSLAGDQGFVCALVSQELVEFVLQLVLQELLDLFFAVTVSNGLEFVAVSAFVFNPSKVPLRESGLVSVRIVYLDVSSQVALSLDLLLARVTEGTPLHPKSVHHRRFDNIQ